MSGSRTVPRTNPPRPVRLRARIWLAVSLLPLSGACSIDEPAHPPGESATTAGGGGVTPPRSLELGAPSDWDVGAVTQPPPSSTLPPSMVDDVYLFGSPEPALAIDPLDPEHLAYASLFELRVSNDGGRSWEARALPVVAPGEGAAGDPSVAFDAEGRLFWSYLARTVDAQGNAIGLDVYVAECDPRTGQILPGAAYNVTASPGVARPGALGFEHDKQWLFSDASPSSPFRNRLYVTWTEFAPTDRVIQFAWSPDSGRSWFLTDPLSEFPDGFVWPTHGTVAPNGDVYVAYHERSDATGSSGQVYLHRSTNGGVSFLPRRRPFPPGRADVTFNRQDRSGAIPGTTFWLQGSAQAWVLADPFAAGRLYVVACDDPDDDHESGDASNVYIVVSNDHGQRWTRPRRIDGDTTDAFQVMPTAAIDPVTGTIVVHYFDNRRGAKNADGHYLLDLYATISRDGGRTFPDEFRLNDLPFDPDPGAPVRFLGPPATTRIGEYNAIAIREGRAGAVWPGNAWGSGGVPSGRQATFDSFGLPVGIDLTPPSVQATGGGLLPVALLGSATFDPLSVDPLGIRFGPGEASEVHGSGHFEDVNSDGLLDVLLHFDHGETGLSLGDRRVRLEGRTPQGLVVEGLDAVRVVAGFPEVIEGFEDGLSSYLLTGSVGTFETRSEAAHDEDTGLSMGGSGGWAVRLDPAVQVAAGDTLSAWIRFGPGTLGRAYLAFGTSTTGALSLVAAPNDGRLILQENPGYGFFHLNTRPQAWEGEHWYRLEVVWDADGTLTGNLYDEDGVTLLNSVTGNARSIVQGGIGFRAFGASPVYFDTVEVERPPTSRPRAR